jgi:hypothetical protein
MHNTLFRGIRTILPTVGSSRTKEQATQERDYSDTMLLLPLQKLLNVPLDSIVLVVDNARSPESPVSVRSCPRSHQKRPGSWDDTDSSTSATPPVLIPIRQDRRNRIHQKNKNFRFAAIFTNGQTGDTFTRSAGTPLRKPIRQLSRKTIHKAIRQDSRNRIHQKNESTGAPLRQPIRQLSRKSIHKEKLKDCPPHAMPTKNTMLNLVVKSTTKIVGIVKDPLRVLVPQSSGDTIHQGSLANQSKIERDMATVEVLTKALQVCDGDGY